MVNLEVTGLKTVLSPSLQRASSIPLPTAIGGISVTVRQSIQQSIQDTNPTQISYSAPLLSVNQVNLCASATTPDCLVTYIVAQMPYELNVGNPSPPIVHTGLVISEGDAGSQLFSAGVAFDHIHVITTCEDQPQQQGCGPVAAHLDGSQVSSQSPAKPGEIVVVYVWGAGSVSPPVTTGAASPVPASAADLPGYPQGLRVGFDFAPNAGPSRYFPANSFSMAYLTPGYVGLYQVNVQLPSALPSVIPCGQDFVQSNLTINLGGPSSFDGASICVQGNASAAQ